MKDRSREAAALLAALDDELAAAGVDAGMDLDWTEAERATLDLVADVVDRRVDLQAAYDRVSDEDVKIKLRLSSELRLLEQEQSRLLRLVSTTPQPAKNPKAVKAARVRWEREKANRGIG